MFIIGSWLDWRGTHTNTLSKTLVLNPSIAFTKEQTFFTSEIKERKPRLSELTPRYIVNDLPITIYRDCVSGNFQNGHTLKNFTLLFQMGCFIPIIIL